MRDMRPPPFAILYSCALSCRPWLHTPRAPRCWGNTWAVGASVAFGADCTLAWAPPRRQTGAILVPAVRGRLQRWQRCACVAQCRQCRQCWHRPASFAPATPSPPPTAAAVHAPAATCSEQRLWPGGRAVAGGCYQCDDGRTRRPPELGAANSRMRKSAAQGMPLGLSVLPRISRCLS